MAERPPLKTKIDSVMSDPGAGAVARVYTDAFLNSLPADQAEGLLSEFQSFIDDVLRPNPDFAQLLTSAMVGRDDKLKLIDGVVAGRGSEIFTNFLKVLAHHDRLELLPVICRQCQLQFELRSGRQRVQVTSARPLSEQALSKIRERLAATFPFQPLIENTTDPSILGGLRIRVGDTVYDSSLRARFNQLRHRVRERSLHEIQSGRDRFSHPERD